MRYRVVDVVAADASVRYAVVDTHTDGIDGVLRITFSRQEAKLYAEMLNQRGR